MFNKKNKLSLSKWLILLISIFWISIISAYKPWQSNLIANDVVSYYGYLPAIFIHHDVTLKFIEKDPEFFSGKYWPETATNSGKVIKTTMGLSMLYAPFFFLGHAVAPIFGEPQTGFSMPYQFCLLLSSLLYLLLGLYYLRKLLLCYFSETVTSLSIASVFFGTNLLWYTTIAGLMSHGYLFSMLIIFIYFTVKWHQQPNIKLSAVVGLIGGLMTLIRPTMLIFMLIFVLFNIYNKQSFIDKLKLFKNYHNNLLVIALGFVIAIAPQLIYWKYITGDWFFYSYVGEHFYFDNPHLIEGLFGFRKGWLLYTPIMTFAVVGLFFLKKNVSVFSLAVITPFCLSVYIILSWWAWWYGGSFGQRAFVDFYGLLTLPMACYFKYIFDKTNQFKKATLICAIVLLISLNLFQTWQFKNGLIHYDAMTKESYFLGFGKTHHTVEWWESCEEPDYERAKKGLPELRDKSNKTIKK